MNPTTKRPNVDFGSTDLVYHKNVFHLFLTRIFHLQIKFEGIIWQFIFNHWCPAFNSLPDLSVYFQQTSEKGKKKWQGFCFFSISNFHHLFSIAFLLLPKHFPSFVFFPITLCFPFPVSLCVFSICLTNRLTWNCHLDKDSWVKNFICSNIRISSLRTQKARWF